MITDKNAAAIDYQIVAPKLTKLAGAFARKYGMNTTDCEEWTNMIFVDLYISHNPEASDFYTWCMCTAWQRMLDLLRKEMRHKVRHTTYDAVTAEFPVSNTEQVFSLEECELSNDAAQVASLALRLPEQVQRTVDSRGGQPRNIRSALRAYLRTEWRWSPARISDAFAEIAHI